MFAAPGSLMLRHPVVLLYTCLLRHRKNLVIKQIMADYVGYSLAPRANRQPNGVPQLDPTDFFEFVPNQYYYNESCKL